MSDRSALGWAVRTADKTGSSVGGGPEERVNCSQPRTPREGVGGVGLGGGGGSGCGGCWITGGGWVVPAGAWVAAGRA